jgi:uncharacterized protein (DUF427 family)
MTLTLFRGPLSATPPEATNYRVDGPTHRLLFEAFPRRVRAVLGSQTVLDSHRAKLLHESAHLPQLYVPREDVREDLLEATDHTTHCPFKGDASYWSVRAGDRVAENAVWDYPEPLEESAWLLDHLAFYWSAMDGWFDEDEEVQGHLCDPYHRIDVRDSSRRVRVLVDGEVVAETDRPKLLSETGLPNRFYIDSEDVRRDALGPSAKHTTCPYKGVASYHTLAVGDRRIEDGAFFYPEPFDGARRIRDHLCFYGEGIKTEVDGERVE